MKKLISLVGKFPWLLILNFTLLQWACVRLAKKVQGKSTVGWMIIRWVNPLTGWWSVYKFIGTNKLNIPLDKGGFEKKLLGYSKNKLIKILVKVSQEINKNEEGIPGDFEKEIKGHSKRHIIKAILMLLIYVRNPELIKTLRNMGDEETVELN